MGIRLDDIKRLLIEKRGKIEGEIIFERLESIIDKYKDSSLLDYIYSIVEKYGENFDRVFWIEFIYTIKDMYENNFDPKEIEYFISSLSSFFDPYQEENEVRAKMYLWLIDSSLRYGKDIFKEVSELYINNINKYNDKLNEIFIKIFRPGVDIREEEIKNILEEIKKYDERRIDELYYVLSKKLKI